MIYLCEILLLIANIAMADYHAGLFRQGKKVKHGWWGFGYLVLSAALSWLNHSWLMFFASLFMRKVVFDIALNLFQGFSPFRVSRETTSIIDKLHAKFNPDFYYPIYFLIFVIINIFI